MKKYIDEQKIKNRVKDLGTSITKNYNDKSKLTILCVLKGSFIFVADLIREIDLDLSIEFIDISSYDGTSRGELILNKGINFDVQNKNILIVEDIVDSGNTINFLYDYLQKQKPKSIQIATLFLNQKHIILIWKLIG